MPSSATLELPKQLARLYELLPVGKDVEIEHLFNGLFGEVAKPRVAQQQQLGPYISKLNRRIAGRKQKIVPGKLKGTYRLSAAR